jgi:hypothetical protein
MSFRLWTIFYVFALVATAMATFGAWGILVAITVLTCWLVMFRGSPTQRRLVVAFVVTALGILCIIFFLVPSVSAVRPLARRMSCFNNLQQVALAIINHDSDIGHLPPLATTDSNGKQLFSWRVAILTRLEVEAVSNVMDVTKPWDAPANVPASRTSILILLCPEHGNTTTNYFAIRGPQTAWGDGDSRSIRDIGDGPENTVLLIEAELPITSWAQPIDLTFDEALDLLSKPPAEGDCHVVYNGPFYKPSVTRTVAFADGRVWMAPVPLDREFAKALLTANGDEAVDRALIEARYTPQLDYAKCYCLMVFTILSLLPAVVLWRRTHIGSQVKSPSPLAPG